MFCLKFKKLLPLQGDRFVFLITQGAALGYKLLPLQGVWSLLAKVECKDNKKLRIIVRNRIFYKIFLLL